MASTDLANELQVSPATMRRDLAYLESVGSVVRAHGGATLASSTGTAVSEVKNRHIAQKIAIAKKAVSFLQNDSLLILDAGTTAEQVAIALDNKFRLTVITNGIRPMSQLATQPNVETIVLGGTLHPATDMICGPAAEQMLQNIRGQYAFLGAQNLAPEHGIASLSFEQARLKSLMMKQADRVYVLADGSKFHRPTDQFWSAFPSEWTLITTHDAPAEVLANMRTFGANQIIIAD